jgi:hypothetical protein
MFSAKFEKMKIKISKNQEDFEHDSQTKPTLCWHTKGESKMDTYEAKFFGDIYRIRGNFAEASSPIQIEGGDGWETTQYQVSNFQHSAHFAMRHFLRESVRASGYDPDECDDLINEAVEEMQ